MCSILFWTALPFVLTTTMTNRTKDDDQRKIKFLRLCALMRFALFRLFAPVCAPLTSAPVCVLPYACARPAHGPLPSHRVTLSRFPSFGFLQLLLHTQSVIAFGIFSVFGRSIPICISNSNRTGKKNTKHETTQTHFSGNASMLNPGRAGSWPHESRVHRS